MKESSLRVKQLKDSYKAPPPSFSFEFFPAKNADSIEKLKQTVIKLAKYKPDYFSITYGAGGSTQDRTYDLVKYIKDNTKIPPAAHLTCVGAKKEETNAIAKEYLDIGVNRIVALRGDMPNFKGEYKPLEGGYAYASDLVEGLMGLGNFNISVAAYPEGHPQADSIDSDIEYLKQKQDAGATSAITQYCFDTDTILRFIDKARKAGVTIPIIPGILTVSNFEQTISFSKGCGASIPDWVHNLYEGINGNQITSDIISAQIASEQCRVLMQEGINQLHFYTLNRHDVASAVFQILGMRANAENVLP